MDYYERTQKAIDFIEENLHKNISLMQIAEEACCSLAHLYRIFPAMVGNTVMEYVRNRRLSLAAHDLIKTEKKIIEIAFDCHFESHESFTRAFRRRYGINPSRYRRQNKEVSFYEKVDVYALKSKQLEGDFVMEPRIVVKNQFKIVGMEIVTTISDNVENYVIPKFWQDIFVPRMKEIKGIVGNYAIAYEEFRPNVAEDGIYHLAAMEVSEFEDIPEGMITKIIPASKYAVFTTHNESEDCLEENHKTCNYIFGTWIPNTEYEIDDYSVEFYYAEKTEHYIPIKQ